jgi:PKD repeat protein
VDCKIVLAWARFTRSLTTRPRILALALALLSCGVALPAAARADADPTKPSASFTFTPPSPATGGTVTLRSTSTPGPLGGEIVSEAWDLDNDGSFDDDTGPQVKTSFATPGDHTVGLQVTDSLGASDVATAVITVLTQSPSASFSVSPQSPSTLETVTFSSTSTDPDGAIVSYAWDLDNDGNFNDGTASDVQRSFLFAGTYTVRLLVTDNDGATAVATEQVEVGNQPPVASFDQSPASPTTSEQITFTSTSTDPDGAITSYAWDLNDDGQFEDGTGAQAQTSFAVPGPHTVRLRVGDNDGATAVATVAVEVANQDPTASFGFSPETPKTLEQVTFTSTSTDPEGSIASLEWDLDNDGQYDDATGPTAQRSFPAAGTYAVKLKVTDSSGASATTGVDVPVANRPPVAAFGFSPSSPKSADEIALTSLSTDPDGSIASYAWDLDDDGQFDDGTGATAITSFATPGQHNVRLQVSDDNGATDVATVPIDVANRPPTAAFTFSPQSPKTLEQVTFTSTSTDPEGSIASLEWDLDNDGQYDDATGPTAQRSFPIAGNYTMKLRVTDSSGALDTETKVVTALNQGPTASFQTSPAEPTTDGPVTFTSTSTDPEGLPLTTAWDLDDDGSFETSGATVQHQFTVPNTYNFEVRVVDASGVSDTASGNITIPNRPPTASVDHTPKSPNTRTQITFTATADDPEHRVKSLAWDSDNDGQFDDGTGTTLSRSFNKPGAYTVRFRIEDLDGASAVTEDVVAVNNQPPTASFVVLPESPTAGAAATLVSTSLDPDTPLEKWLWDLDGDGEYDDGTGPQIKHTFPAAGSYTVGLRVFDSEEVDNFVVQTIAVQLPPAPATAAPQLAPSSYQLLSPFPVVRLAGRIGQKGTRLRLFKIEAPLGARVLLRCRGKGCPFRRSARSAEAPGDGKAHASASLRIRKLEKRLLKPGVKITIYVTKAGTIGKYVQFKFRHLRPPARIDRCLLPTDPSKPVECPS